MKKLTDGEAVTLINKFAHKLDYQRNTKLRKEGYLAILPLEDHQAVLMLVDADKNGEIGATYLAAKNVFIDDKINDAILDPQILGKRL